VISWTQLSVRAKPCFQEGDSLLICGVFIFDKATIPSESIAGIDEAYAVAAS
jgi:hypothetical protein